MIPSLNQVSFREDWGRQETLHSRQSSLPVNKDTFVSRSSNFGALFIVSTGAVTWTTQDERTDPKRFEPTTVKTPE